jgi:hypothetical protein
MDTFERYQSEYPGLYETSIIFHVLSGLAVIYLGMITTKSDPTDQMVV